MSSQSADSSVLDAKEQSQEDLVQAILDLKVAINNCTEKMSQLSMHSTLIVFV